ncbi:MAG: hypothetical protein EA350_06480 [Gemmatimonadales bacterium]|nr:MAG: hypothetical protein EA350_06480 [Gemmatimonadales bacterium]
MAPRASRYTPPSIPPAHPPAPAASTTRSPPGSGPLLFSGMRSSLPTPGGSLPAARRVSHGTAPSSPAAAGSSLPGPRPGAPPCPTPERHPRKYLAIPHLECEAKPGWEGLACLTPSHPDIALSGGRGEIPDMTKKALLSEILRLPPEERVEFLGDAWDAIASRPEDVPLPEWHLQELERRLAEPSPRHVPWAEVRERLKGSA